MKVAHSSRGPAANQGPRGWVLFRGVASAGVLCGYPAVAWE